MKEQKSKWPYHNNTIVVKMAGRIKSKWPHDFQDRLRIDGRWKLIDVEAGRIFTGPDHEIKAEKYLKKKCREYQERTKEEMYVEKI